MEIEELINELKGKGLENGQILNSLKVMLEEGNLKEEDYQKALDVLEGQEKGIAKKEDEDAEKAQASKIFDYDLD